MVRTALFVAVLAWSTPLLAGKTPELRGFWDAVYRVTDMNEHPSCNTFGEGTAPPSCSVADFWHHPECMKYFTWESGGMLICPDVCANPSRVKVEHGVMKFDVEYVPPSLRHPGDGNDRYDERHLEIRHIEVPLSLGKVSIGQYANTNRYVELGDDDHPLSFPLNPIIKGWHHDGARTPTIYFDRVDIIGAFSEAAGHCAGAVLETADKGLEGYVHVRLGHGNTNADDDWNVTCEMKMTHPNHKQGPHCAEYQEADLGSSGGDGGGGGGHSGGGGACKSQCRATAGECRRSCHGSGASCASSCNHAESACTSGC